MHVLMYVCIFLSSKLMILDEADVCREIALFPPFPSFFSPEKRKTEVYFVVAKF